MTHQVEHLVAVLLSHQDAYSATVVVAVVGIQRVKASVALVLRVSQLLLVRAPAGDP